MPWAEGRLRVTAPRQVRMFGDALGGKRLLQTRGSAPAAWRFVVGIGTSIFLIAVGAILDFAVKVHTNGFNLNTIGLILMIVGAIGLVLSLIFFNSWGGGMYRRQSRVVNDGPNTYVEEQGQGRF